MALVLRCALGLAVVLGSMLPADLLLRAGSRPAFADPISDKRAEAAQLAAQINALGAKIDSLTEEYAAAQQQAKRIADSLALVRSQVATDRGQVKTVKGRLRLEAVNAFTSGGSGPDTVSVTLDVLQGHMGLAGLRTGYMATVAIMEQNTVDSLHIAERALSAKEAELREEQQANQAALAEIANARQAALQTSKQEQSLLSSVKGELARLVAEKQQAEEEAAALVVASGAGYANPLRAVSGLVAKRIDQGVDYAGVGPLYAIGPGVITNVYNSGWPGGAFIAERLSAGSYVGQYWYSAEDIAPAVSVGEQVGSNTVIGTLTDGSAGIELGWASPPGNGVTMAMATGEAAHSGDPGSVSSAYGVAASSLLTSLGAPPGRLQS
jgi:murein DD-endopeptidase MepM/ murein hydrolase activator NlpD